MDDITSPGIPQARQNQSTFWILQLWFVLSIYCKTEFKQWLLAFRTPEICMSYRLYKLTDAVLRPGVCVCVWEHLGVTSSRDGILALPLPCNMEPVGVCAALLPPRPVLCHSLSPERLVCFSGVKSVVGTGKRWDQDMVSFTVSCGPFPSCVNHIFFGVVSLSEATASVTCPMPPLAWRLVMAVYSS